MKHNIGSLAAVVSFFGFSALLPILALLIYLGTFLAPHAAVEQVLRGVLSSFIPSIPSGSTMGASFALGTIKRLTTYGSEMSVIGLIGLLWSTVGGFVTLQQALDTIFEVPKRRSFWLQYIVGFLMMGILLVLTTATSLASSVSPRLISRFGHFTAFRNLHLIHLIGQSAFPLILFITCYCCYRVLPSRTLRPMPLVTGSVLATLVIYVSRVLFSVYTRHLGNYEIMYGTLTFVMLLTFWIYIVCMILLACAEIAATIDKLMYYE